MLSEENDSEESKVEKLAQKKKTFTRKEAEQCLGLSQTSCGRLLKRMMDRGQIIREGKGKNTRYRLAG